MDKTTSLWSREMRRLVVRHLTRLAGVLAAGLLVVGCTATSAGGAGSSSSPTTGATPTPTPNPTPTAPTYSVGTGSGDLILKIDTGGGLVPIETLLNHLPGLALYGDGRIIVPGPQAEIYPGPLLPNLRVTQITPDEIQKIMAAADQAGLLGPDASFDATGVADGPTTTFTTIVAGKTHTISAYALGLDSQGLDPAVTAAREKLLDLQTRMTGLSAFLGRAVGDGTAYQPTEMRLFTAPATNETPVNGVTPTVATWPLSADPATAGSPARYNSNYRCLAIAGTDLATFLAAAQTANAITIWKAPSGKYSLMVRPLYPDESGC